MNPSPDDPLLEALRRLPAPSPDRDAKARALATGELAFAAAHRGPFSRLGAELGRRVSPALVLGVVVVYLGCALRVAGHLYGP